MKKIVLMFILLIGLAALLASCENPEPQIDSPDVGSLMEFGGYNWHVLDVRDGRALIITENIVRARAYHNAPEDVTWATSDMRRYLNSEFYESFREADRARIAETVIINADNQWLGTPAGNDTTDKIFLLSIEEVVRYFGDSGMFARGTDPNERVQGWVFDPDILGIYEWGIHDQYSSARIAANAEGEVLWWWLRSPGMSALNVAGVFYEGYILLTNILATSSTGGVRPALWLYY